MSKVGGEEDPVGAEQTFSLCCVWPSRDRENCDPGGSHTAGDDVVLM